jgi:hypothetical protein
MIGTDVLYDFHKHQGYTPLNFIVDPIDWSVIAYTQAKTRTALPTEPHAHNGELPILKTLTSQETKKASWNEPMRV